MNIYIVPIKERKNLTIKKLVAQSAQHAKEKLFNYFYDKYDWLEGDDLNDIKGPLNDEGIDFGDLYDIENFT